MERPGHVPVRRSETEQHAEQLRVNNHELHILFAQAMTAAAERQTLPAAVAQRARRLVFLAGRPATFDGTADVDEMPLGRPRPWELLRDALTPGSPSRYVVARAGIAVCVAGFVASALGIEHAYWAMSAAVLVVHQGFDWVRTLQRGFERMVGTCVGLGLAAVVLTLHPQGLWLVLIIATLQFIIEMLIVRNYALAAVFITPIALTIASGGHPVDDVGGLLFARGMDTLIGCSLALAVYLLVGRRQKPRHVPEAVARVLDAVAATSRHLAVGAVSTEPAKAARRDLQIRAIAMMAAYDAGVDGTRASVGPPNGCGLPSRPPNSSPTGRWVTAGRWITPTMPAQQRGIGRSLFGPDGIDEFTTALSDLAAAVRSGSAPPDRDQLATSGTTELTNIRDSLVSETD